MSSGQGKGNKGGSSQKPSVSQLRKMQQRLKNSLEQMQQGGMKQGGKGQSEKFARMAAQQAAIRQELQKLQESMKAQGATAKQLFQIAKEMDKSETDLVNKRISEALINRQKQIVTRLLKSEKALREQEKQKERKSETANFKIQGNQTYYLQYKKQIRNGKEFILRVFPETNQYYEKRIDNYLNNRDNQKND
jgi:glycerol-3-phosphate dehydrogenase